MKLLVCALLCVVAQGVRLNSPDSDPLSFVFTAGGYNEASVFLSNGAYTVKSGIDKINAVAYGSFDDGLSSTGWGVLRIRTNKKFDDQTQLYAAGFLEGALTGPRIWQSYQNMYSVFFTGSAPTPALYQFLEQQDLWVRSRIKGDARTLTPYWLTVQAIVAQFDGLNAGYNQYAPTTQTLPQFAFQLLSGVGDFLDLLPALQKERRIQWEKLSPQETSRMYAKINLCSGLVKVLPDLSELYSAHSSWFTYGAMNRIYKHYFFDVQNTFWAAKKMSFSSYPGFLNSLDDFYIMDSGLTMIQTTNSILNSSLFDYVTPNALFAWQRVRLSNALSHGGKEWGQYFAQHNTGTYNNQYMVIDYKKFLVGKQLLDGTLYVIEQIPGYVEYADVTDQLVRGYWPSYNVPYFPKIYNASGYPAFVEKKGVSYSYQMAPRAKIFRRDQGTVTDLESMKAIMRYNDYKNDPLSDGNPGNAICSRFDLEQENPGPFGCYDTKVTSFSRQSKLISEAINGPTTSHGLPPFQWAPFANSTLHDGQPALYNFDFVEMNPQWEKF